VHIQWLFSVLAGLIVLLTTPALALDLNTFRAPHGRP
jgi:hypothetical protein